MLRCKKKTNKLTNDRVLLTTDFAQISLNVMLVSTICFHSLIQDSTLYSTALSSFSCMQQILVNSLFIFMLLQIFSNFPCYGFLDTLII